MQDFVSEYRKKYMWFYLMILLLSVSVLYQWVTNDCDVYFRSSNVITQENGTRFVL